MPPLSGRVLVVEDQEFWREKFFGESLGELGLTVYAARTKEEALALLDSHQFDLAVIDINLTNITGNTDGLAVVEWIEKRGSQIPIIVVSGTEDGFKTLHERNYRPILVEMHKNDFDLVAFIAHVKQAITGVKG